ncbi:MAG: sulfatase-like hydrolase/transferase [Bacteroidota bacterium]
MEKKVCLFLLVLCTIFCSCGKGQKGPNSNSKEKQTSGKAIRPNILFLLADDLGYGELGAYGQKMVKTPILDSLANLGMRFTDFYAGSPVCSPSRAVLMTGIPSSKNTIRGNNGLYTTGEWRRVALKKEEPTLGEMLGNAGYQTAFIGKWHLGIPDDVGTWAHARGFQYAVQEQWTARYGGRNFDGPMEYINGIQDSINFDYTQWDSHDDFRTQLALDYLDTKRNTDKPFFLFMSFRAPHGHEYVIGNKELYRDLGWPAQERLHAAKITLLDKQVGRLLRKLETMGELENTLILFTSDNGPHQEGDDHDHEFFNSNGALKGYKRDLYEGGLRVPFIAYWKGKIAEGLTSSFIGSFQDIMPTLAQVAGTPVPEQATGTSLLPVLLGESHGERPYLNWEFVKTSRKNSFRQSVRMGNFKGVRYAVDAPTELYDLETDISETNNIADQHPEIIKKMNHIFKEDRIANSHYPYGGSQDQKK